MSWAGAWREELLQRLFDLYAPDAVVITCGADGSMGYNGGRIYRSAGYSVQVVNRLGRRCVRCRAAVRLPDLGPAIWPGLWGAMAALKMTIPQNVPLIDLRMSSGWSRAGTWMCEIGSDLEMEV